MCAADVAQTHAVEGTRVSAAVEAEEAGAREARGDTRRGRNKVHWIYSITENMYGRRVPVE